MATHPDSNHIRVPAHLSATNLQRALDELDGKIRTLHRRNHAIAVGSTATYQQHAEVLEAKRTRLLEQLRQATAAAPDAPTAGLWDEIRRGVENLRQDLHNLL